MNLVVLRKIIGGQDSSSWDYEWLYFMPICQMIVDVVSVVDQPHCHPKSHAASMAKKLYRYWPVIVILKSMAVQPQYNIVIVIQWIYFMTIYRYIPDLFTLSLRDSVSYGLGTKSVWTLALPQNCLVHNRSSSSLRLSLLLEQSDPLVTPPGQQQTNKRAQ